MALSIRFFVCSCDILAKYECHLTLPKIKHNLLDLNQCSAILFQQHNFESNKSVYKCIQNPFARI